MEASDDSQINIIFWPNGKTADSIINLKITSNLDSVRKLKDILIYEKNYSKSLYDRIIFYNYKGIELEDADIPFLKNKQIIYISFDGSRFSTLNYVNEYKFVKPIKSGGYAQVYLAKHVLTNDLVAIKKTNLHKFSAEELYNISREAVYLMNLTHVNIVKMYNSYVYDNCLYNVMSYCEGGELTQLLINPAPLSEERIKEIFTQIHNAVKYIHSRNVIHRDLKLNNLLFLDKEQTHIVLIDFGISGMNTGFNSEVVKAGTLKYTPPELLSGEKYQSSSKIDIWALGVILYLLNFREFPFDGKNDSIVINKICGHEVEFPKGKKIKVSLVKLIQGLLIKDPNTRIDINDDLFEKWYNDKGSEYKVFDKTSNAHSHSVGRKSIVGSRRVTANASVNNSYGGSNAAKTRSSNNNNSLFRPSGIGLHVKSTKNVNSKSNK